MSWVSALYWYYKNTVLRSMWYHFILIQSNLKVYIYLLCFNTQRQTTAPFDNTIIISSSNHQNTGLYQASDDHCEGYSNSDLIRLLEKSQAIHYCNQSVLAIFQDLNIFVFSITIVDLISRSALGQLWVYYMQAMCITHWG